MQVREREKTIAHLQQRLAYFRSIPAHRRLAEHADEGERDCLAMLDHYAKTSQTGDAAHKQAARNTHRTIVALVESRSDDE